MYVCECVSTRLDEYECSVCTNSKLGSLFPTCQSESFYYLPTGLCENYVTWCLHTTESSREFVFGTLCFKVENSSYELILQLLRKLIAIILYCVVCVCCCCCCYTCIDVCILYVLNMRKEEKREKAWLCYVLYFIFTWVMFLFNQSSWSLFSLINLVQMNDGMC